MFCKYPIEIVEKAVSPAFGMPQKFKQFLPSLGEIGEYLEAEMEPRRREEYWRQLHAENARLLAAPQAARPSLAELHAKYGEDWGLMRKQTKPKPFLTADQLKEIAGAEWDKIPDAK